MNHFPFKCFTTFTIQLTNLATAVCIAVAITYILVTIQSSDECLSLPEILLVRADDRRSLTGYQLDRQPTCAFVACRNDYLKIKQLLKDESIRNIRYCIGNNGEKMVFICIYIILAMVRKLFYE